MSPTRLLLKDVFIDEAFALGCSHADAIVLFQALPARIRDTYASGEKSPGRRYLYGDFFRIGTNPGIGLPFQMPLVSNLIHAYLIAKKHLSRFEYNEWSKRASSPAKHFGAIFEMLVVTNVKSDSNLVYEKKHAGVRDKSVDWSLENKDGSFLLEVKSRLGQIAEILEQELKSEKAHSLPSEPIPNIEKLFIDTTDKFRPVDKSTNIQGAALFLSALIPRVPFENYFFKHVRERLHFVALVREEGVHVNLIAVSDEIKARVLSAFGWVDDANFFLETD